LLSRTALLSHHDEGLGVKLLSFIKGPVRTQRPLNITEDSRA
jgi:hypothetical protein